MSETLRNNSMKRPVLSNISNRVLFSFPLIFSPSCSCLVRISDRSRSVSNHHIEWAVATIEAICNSNFRLPQPCLLTSFTKFVVGAVISHFRCPYPLIQQITCGEVEGRAFSSCAHSYEGQPGHGCITIQPVNLCTTTPPLLANGTLALKTRQPFLGAILPATSHTLLQLPALIRSGARCKL
jgi:hypothetical protein